MRKVLRVSTVAALVVGVLALFVGVAQSVIPSADGTYYACYKIVGGNLRIIDESASCRRDEAPISWDAQGEPGAPGVSYAGYTHMTLEEGEENPVTIPAGTPVSLANLSLPDPPDGGGYLATVTFEVQNDGPGDAGLVCHVGNQMAYSLFVPRSQVSNPTWPGVYGEDQSVFTLSGLSDYNGVSFACGVNSYDFGTGLPVIRLAAYTLSAVQIDQLDNQAPTE